MYEQNTCKSTWKRQGRENNQIITACHNELHVQEMTMNKKLIMIGLTSVSDALQISLH